MNKRLRRIAIFLMILGVIAPICLYLIFDLCILGSFGLPTSLEFSDWFSFWSSFLSTVVTAWLGWQTYALSIRLDEAQMQHVIAENKSKFSIYHLKRDGFADGLIYTLKPHDVVFHDVCLTSAMLTLPYGSEVHLDVLKDVDDYRQQRLAIPDKDKEIVERWLDTPTTVTNEHAVANITLTFSCKLSAVHGDKTVVLKTCADVHVPNNSHAKLLEVFNNKTFQQEDI